jgi:predicted Zn-dependent peptidase
LHANDRLGFSEYGTEEGVKALTEQQVQKAFSNLLEAGELELFYCGTMSGDEVAGLFRSAMPIPTGVQDVVQETPYYNKDVCADTIVEEMNVTQGKMTLCLTSPYTGISPEYPALLLFTEILGGYTGSRLFCNVREKMSLCYYASAGLTFTTGEVFIASGIENSKFDVARDAVLEQLRDLCEGGLTEEELEQARRTKINALRSMQDVPRSMESYWQTRMMCGLDENVDALIKRLESATLADVVAAGRTLRVALIYFLKGVGA